ncbi:hypothetical protein ACGF12_18020 [Kitasatospora sp. NPDC048296]|uniref:hypothetical protein n=1 Tax=Kitasatospora sp. NPDC048296 TaxID=3364048 RepID=UPI00371E95A9
MVLPGAAGADAERIAEGYAVSLTMGTGQFCTNPALLFVPEDPDLLQRIATAIARSTGGAMLSPGIHDSYLARTAQPPAGTAAGRTSVGATAINHWSVPVTYQDWPDSLLPSELRDGNPLAVPRRHHP